MPPTGASSVRGSRKLPRSTPGSADARSYLAGRIRSGGQGVWGAVPMPPQRLEDEDAAQLAQWILAGSP